MNAGSGTMARTLQTATSCALVDMRALESSGVAGIACTLCSTRQLDRNLGLLQRYNATSKTVNVILQYRT